MSNHAVGGFSLRPRAEHAIVLPGFSFSMPGVGHGAIYSAARRPTERRPLLEFDVPRLVSLGVWLLPPPAVLSHEGRTAASR